MDLPIDHFRLLGVSPSAQPDAILRRLQSRCDSPPNQGFTHEALLQRQMLLRQSADLLTDSESRARYEEALLALSASHPNETVGLDLSASSEVGGLILLWEAGAAQEAFQLSRQGLQPPQAPALGSGREADLTLLAALSCRAAADEEQQQRRYESAAQILRAGIELQQRMGKLPEQQALLEQARGNFPASLGLLERSEQVGPFDNRIGRNLLLWTAASIAAMLLVKANFLDGGQSQGFGRGVASAFAGLLYVISILGMIYAAIVLLGARVDQRIVPNPRTIRGAAGSFLFSRDRVLTSILMETAKVSVMVFAILIGSQLLALTLRSFGGEEYIEHFLRSFEDPRTLLLVVMIVLFILGFVLDFIEIIFIVIPIVGPVVYGADPNIMHPAWITILIAVNLQTSFITPPFGFALFYLRGVAPPEIQTSHIYRGIVPFVIIQVVGLTILWFFPQITTFLPELLPEN